MNFSKHLKTILWDVDPRRLDAKRDKSFIITRVAEKGSWPDVRWLKKKYGVSSIKRMVSGSRNTSAKTKSFWKLF